jgi:hypothetical protein
MPLALIGRFIGSKLGGWAVAGLVAVVLGGRRNAAEIRSLTTGKATAEAARDAAVSIAAERRVEVVTRTNTIIKEVERATVQDECPVAPSLRAALVGLRDFGAKGRNRDGVPGGEAPATGAPVRLRPAPLAAQP